MDLAQHARLTACCRVQAPAGASWTPSSMAEPLQRCSTRSWARWLTRSWSGCPSWTRSGSKPAGALAVRLCVHACALVVWVVSATAAGQRRLPYAQASAGCLDTSRTQGVLRGGGEQGAVRADAEQQLSAGPDCAALSPAARRRPVGRRTASVSTAAVARPAGELSSVLAALSCMAARHQLKTPSPRAGGCGRS